MMDKEQQFRITINQQKRKQLIQQNEYFYINLIKSKSCCHDVDLKNVQFQFNNVQTNIQIIDIQIFICSFKFFILFYNQIIYIFMILIKNLQKVIPKTNLNYNYSIFSKLFKSKSKPQKTQSPKQTQNKTNTQNQNLLQKQQTLPLDLYQRKKQIQLNKDYATIPSKIKLIPDNVGDGGIQQILYWSEGVTNSSQIIVLVNAFNRLMRLNPDLQIPNSYKFIQFQKKMTQIAYLCHDFETIKSFAQFGFVYEINEQEYWKKLQQKFIKKLSKFDNIDILIQIFQMFAYAKKGQDIYKSIEQIVQPNLSIIKPQQICMLIYGFYNVKIGEKKFIRTLIEIYKQNISIIQKDYLFLVIPILKKAQQIPNQIYMLLEQRLLKQMNNLNLIQLCKIGQGYGYQRGTDLLWKNIQEKIIKMDINIKYLNGFIYGIMTTYRCTFAPIQKVLPLIKQNLQRIPPKQLSQISKGLYIYQYQNKQLYSQIQQILIQYLRDVGLVDLEVITIIAKNYSIGRHGSRDIYKMLQIVMTERMNDIQQNRLIFDTILTIYSNSDLCSADFMNLLKQLS